MDQQNPHPTKPTPPTTPKTGATTMSTSCFPHLILDGLARHLSKLRHVRTYSKPEASLI